jgi:hypothetical protein
MQGQKALCIQQDSEITACSWAQWNHNPGFPKDQGKNLNRSVLYLGHPIAGRSALIAIGSLA